MRSLSYCLCLLLLTGILGLGSTAHAQRTSGALGVGGQVGEPAGLTLKLYNENTPSYDFLAAWSLVDDELFLNGHALWNYDIQAQNIDQDFEWFFGPGAYLQVLDRPGNDEEVEFGISGAVGLNFVINRRFELYGQVTPRLGVIPETDGNVGGGLGFRYYF